MIALDTSALVAVVLGEPELEQFSSVMSRQPCVVAAASVTEAVLVLESRQGPDAIAELRLVLRDAATEVVPVDEELAWAAHAAWRRFGKGRHPAALNLGDCFSYALAKTFACPCSSRATTSCRPTSSRRSDVISRAGTVEVR